jgi:hypothetical protein
MTLTYVTALMRVYEMDNTSIKNLETRLEQFKHLLDAKVPLLVYVCKEYSEEVLHLCKDLDHVQVVVCELEDTWTYNACEPWSTKLPTHRNQPKDTFRFLALINAKVEFVVKGILLNPFKMTNFAWIDFNIFHIIKDVPLSIKRLQRLCDVDIDSNRLTVPGCWAANNSWDGNHINWRFCGGFIFGTSLAFLEIYELYKAHMTEYFNKFNCISWEVNVWAYFESMYPELFKTDWYAADHNDRILDVPAIRPQIPLLTKRTDATSGTYTFPSQPNYQPTSSSFLVYKGTPLLNVRLVNYLLTPEGSYIIHHPKRSLITHNILCNLSPDLNTIDDYKWINNMVSLAVTDEEIQGIEDARLWLDSEGGLRFIATQRQWSPSKQNRMMIGSVDTQKGAYRSCEVIEPPGPTGCEKNWIPILLDGKDRFIYQWHPFQIGEIVEGRLQIITSMARPSLAGMKGSTIFVPWKGRLLGVIHSSEEGSPRKYYHYLITLDPVTGLPLQISQKFVFGRLGVEFCIGFCLEPENRIRFWYSQHDRDPMWTSVGTDAFEWTDC